MSVRRTLGVVVGTVATMVATLVVPAHAAHPWSSRITVRVSDYTPTAGDGFVVRGLYASDGTVAAGQVVRLQSYAAGGWANIRGARVMTNSDGRYRMRVILFLRGVRDLRVMGMTTDGHDRTFHRFVVQVH